MLGNLWTFPKKTWELKTIQRGALQDESSIIQTWNLCSTAALKGPTQLDDQEMKLGDRGGPLHHYTVLSALAQTYKTQHQLTAKINISSLVNTNEPLNCQTLTRENWYSWCHVSLNGMFSRIFNYRILTHLYTGNEPSCKRWSKPASLTANSAFPMV